MMKSYTHTHPGSHYLSCAMLAMTLLSGTLAFSQRKPIDREVSMSRAEDIPDAERRSTVLPGAAEDFFSLVGPGEYTDTRRVLNPVNVGHLYYPDQESESSAKSVFAKGVAGVVGRPQMAHGAAVRIDEKMLFSKVGQFWLRVPWLKDKVLVSRQTAEFQTNGDYHYHGRVSVDGVEVGYLSVLLEGEKQFGRLITDKQAYRLEPLGRKAMALLEEYPDNSVGSGCVSDGSSSSAPEATPGGGTKNIIQAAQAKSQTSQTEAQIASAAPVVRVLAMFTDRANAIWDPVASAQGSMAELNEALTNSEISQQQLRFELVGVVGLPGFVETTNNIDGDVLALRTNMFVQGQRTLAQADVVVLLTDGNYFANSVFGSVGPDGTFPGDPLPTRGYAIVEVDAPGERQTFPHEVAHLLGGQHDDIVIDAATLPNVGNYAHGYQ